VDFVEVVIVVVVVIVALVVGIGEGFCFVAGIEVEVVDFVAGIGILVVRSTSIDPVLLEDFEKLGVVELNRS
jgi:hypothetical protein